MVSVRVCVREHAQCNHSAPPRFHRSAHALTEELTLAAQHDAKRDWQADYDTLIGPLIQPTTPSYLLYRLDAKNTLGHIWLLITWVPEAAPIRQKMLYASTKATLKTEFGSAYIKEEIHATTAAEVTLDGYHRHKAAHNSPAPLTLREEELLEIRQNELNCSGGIGAGGGGGGVGAVVHTPTGLGGIHCPMTAPAEQAIVDMLRGSYNYLQFSIELQREQIELVKAGQVEPVAALQREVPADHARYHLYLFRHTHEGDYEESFVFVYSMPGYNCPVKERMMYSSCKAPFVEAIERLGVVVAKKVRDGFECIHCWLSV